MAAKRIRVVYVIGSLALGGAEKQLVRLVNGLDRDRFQPSLICLVEGGGDLEGGLADDVGVVSPRPREGRSRFAVGRRAVSMLAGELRRQKPDIVHAYLPAAYVPTSIAAWSVRVPLIVAGRRGLPTGNIYSTAWWRMLSGLANRVIDLQVFNSEALRESAIKDEGVRRERTRVVHNGIDVPPLNGRALPAELGWPGTQAVMVANFIAYKGHANVLRAVARVLDRHPEFRLVLFGDGPERAMLEPLARDLALGDHLVFGGRRPDADRLVQGFDFSILGSSEESLPNAVMESMAAGVPVVSTRVGGVAELVTDGVDGRLVPYGDVDAMAAAITWMIEHAEERHQMGVAGRRRIGTDFSTESMVRQTEDAYGHFLMLSGR